MSVHDIENDTMQSAWDLVAPSIAQEDAITSSKGCSTLQLSTFEKENDAHGIITGDSSCSKNVLSKLYEKAAKKQFMNFQDYCKKVRSMINEQQHIVMFNRAWCKKYVHNLRYGSKIDGCGIFLSGRGGSGKSHCVNLIQRDMSYMLSTVLNADPDQPIVLITAPTGSAAFQIGGTTIHSAFLLYEGSTRKPSWEKHTIMQLKLEHIMLSITDEISMIGFTQFQEMNETVCQIKGTCNGNCTIPFPLIVP